jgi:hypothetical protein
MTSSPRRRTLVLVLDDLTPLQQFSPQLLRSAHLRAARRGTWRVHTGEDAEIEERITAGNRRQLLDCTGLKAEESQAHVFRCGRQRHPQLEGRSSRAPVIEATEQKDPPQPAKTVGGEGEGGRRKRRRRKEDDEKDRRRRRRKNKLPDSCRA